MVEEKLVSKGGKEVAWFDEGKQWEKASENVVRVSVKKSRKSAGVESFSLNRKLEGRWTRMILEIV